MAINKDLYEILGIDKTASPDEIKKAYRRLARKFHPDVNPGDKSAEENFKEIGMAYEILSDPEKRKRYDMLGAAAFQPGAGATGSPFEGFDFSSGGFTDLGDLFEMFFGGAGPGRATRREGPMRGADLQVVVDVTLEDVVKGTNKSITLQHSIPCSYCGGSGVKTGSNLQICPTCQGSGRIMSSSGFLRVTQTCSQCGGRGQINPNPCPSCAGTGRERREEKLTVKIPAGVTNNSRIRVTGKGDQGEMGGPPGDLYVYTRVLDHPFFKRVEDNICCEVPVTFAEAALGASIEVPTITGKGRLRIPAGTQSGQQIRIKGKGIPHLRGWGQGDQICEVVVQTPTSLSMKEKELLEELSKYTKGEKLREHLKYY